MSPPQSTGNAREVKVGCLYQASQEDPVEIRASSPA